MGWLTLRLRALRAFSFPVSVLPVVVVAAAVRPVGQWQWDVLAASALGVMLLHATGNLLNDYFDFRSGVDRRLTDDAQRPGRFLVRGELLPRDVLIEAGACLVLLTPVAAYLLWRCGLGLLWFGGAALVGLYAYTGWPLHLKYRALGEPLIFVVFGPVLLLGAGYAQTGQVSWTMGILSVPIGLATTAILVGNNVRDQQEDGDAGVVTLTHRVGLRAARVLYVVLVVGSVVGTGAIGVAGLGPLGLGAAPVLLVALWEPLRAIARHERLPDIDARTAGFETLLLLFTAAVLIAGGGLQPVG